MGTFEIGLNVFCLMIKQQVMGTWEENVVLGMRMTPRRVIYLHAYSEVGECFGND